MFEGTASEQRLYQLIRQPGPIADRKFEIEFLDPGVEASVLVARMNTEFEVLDSAFVDSGFGEFPIGFDMAASATQVVVTYFHGHLPVGTFFSTSVLLDEPLHNTAFGIGGARGGYSPGFTPAVASNGDTFLIGYYGIFQTPSGAYAARIDIQAPGGVKELPGTDTFLAFNLLNSFISVSAPSVAYDGIDYFVSWDTHGSNDPIEVGTRAAGFYRVSPSGELLDPLPTELPAMGPHVVAFGNNGVALLVQAGVARFVRTWARISVRAVGDGSGAIVSSPDGIACGTACTAIFDAGTIVTLYAQPAAGSRFKRWRGVCAGQGPQCVVPIDATNRVTTSAVFSDGGDDDGSEDDEQPGFEGESEVRPMFDPGMGP